MEPTRLRTLRTELGLSLHKVAEKTQTSTATISRIETRKRTVRMERQRVFSEIFGTPESELFDVGGLARQ